MRVLATLVMAAMCGVSCSRSSDDFQPDTVIALERGALDRWGKGDPQGFFDIMAPDQTYFDPMTAKRIDGHEAVERYIAPFAGKPQHPVSVAVRDFVATHLHQPAQVTGSRRRGLRLRRRSS